MADKERDKESQCFIHFSAISKDDEILITATGTSLCKIVECRSRWIVLDGEAREVSERSFEYMNENEGKQLICDEAAVRSDLFYHRKCYQKLTNTRVIEMAEKRVGIKEKTSEKTNEPPRKSRRSSTETASSTASSSTSTSANVKTKSTGILPRICIICKTKELYYNDKNSRKRTVQYLTQCETIDCGQLREAVEQKKDEDILVHIRDKDCVAIEVCYHKTCYKNYTRFLSKESIDAPVDSVHATAYKVFCKEIIIDRMCKNKELLFMNKLVEMFRKYIIKYDENQEGTEYRASKLKRRLQKSHPQLVFHAPTRRNRSEIVFAEDLSAGTFAEQSIDVAEDESSDTDEVEEDVPVKPTQDSESVNLFGAALVLRNTIKDVPSLQCQWPPTADDFNEDVILQAVPKQLFNFLCWCLGLSDVPSLESLRDSIADKDARKVDSIAQDLVYISAKGNKQTPKSLSLGMLTRQVTGSAEMISILNAFGHCASYDTVIRHETALATLQSHEHSLLPRDMVKSEPTVLVFDNQDYSEETKSGKGQTHIAAGIAIQRQGTQPNTTKPKELVSKRIRTLSLEEEELPYFHLGSKKSVKLSHLSEFVSTDVKEHFHIQAIPRRLDFIYALCKIQAKELFICLPGWTGFNTLLHNDVPTMSRISYLPIIDKPITEMCTINEILCQSVQIADELQLQQVLLVADEAVYAKLQQVRWKNDAYSKRCVVRLGEFHTIMSYCSCIGKRFKDSGLEVQYTTYENVK